MKTISDYQKEFKELTFDNNGYAEIRDKFLKNFKELIVRAEELL